MGFRGGRQVGWNGFLFQGRIFHSGEMKIVAERAGDNFIGREDMSFVGEL